MSSSHNQNKPPSAELPLESPVSRLRSSVAFLTDRNAGHNPSPDESVSILDGDWNNRVHKRKHSRTKKVVSPKVEQGSAAAKAELPRKKPSSSLKRLMAKFFR